MRLNPRTILVIIALSAVALVGLIWLQVHLLMNTVEQREEAFQRNVSAALASIVQRLESDETARQLAFAGAPLANGRKTTIAVVGARKGSAGGEVRVEARQFDHLLPPGEKLQKPPLEVLGNRVRYRVEKPQHIRLRMFDPGGGSDTILIDTMKLPGTYETRIDTVHRAGMTRVFQYSADSMSFVVSVATSDTHAPIQRGVPTREREEAVRKAFDKLIFVEGLPIERRLSVSKIDSFAARALHESGIETPYVFGVISSNDSVTLANSSDFAEQLRRSEFRSQLFPGDLFAEQNDLALIFPERRMFVLKQIAPMIAATCVFISMVIFGFGYTIRTVFTQKRMASHMVDFINNMTHEFKTPISTIALAAEALSRTDVLSDNERAARYSSVIQDENSRMRHQVEKILQMATLEEGGAELELGPINVHDVIASAVDNIMLHVESKQGNVATTLDAERHVIDGDAVHISNIMHNLLENAIKYSPDQPQIEISTENVSEHVVVRVSDQGIGMTSEDTKRAFDKYFRVSTGNRHDVKGFGLGLSYVKLMVEAHRGSVRIMSTPNKGTTVEITLPIRTDEKSSSS
ncbi:MAG: HAMP domain-containing histidine kinase [Ignavibacteriae bacterium]|nr:HAMP domain-containing histidine kinase [Ignavibacteriota bacterium]